MAPICYVGSSTSFVHRRMLTGHDHDARWTRPLAAKQQNAAYRSQIQQCRMTLHTGASLQKESTIARMRLGMFKQLQIIFIYLQTQILVNASIIRLQEYSKLLPTTLSPNEYSISR